LSRLALLAACLAVGPSIGLTASCELPPAEDAKIVEALRLMVFPARRWARRGAADRHCGAGGGGGGGSAQPGVEDPSPASQIAPRSVDERRMSNASELEDGDV